MDVRLIPVGFGNLVAAERIVAIVGADSAPIRRLIGEARDRGRLIDATYGRRTRAVIFTDSDHVILSAVHPQTVAHRVSGTQELVEAAEELEDAQAVGGEEDGGERERASGAGGGLE